MRGGDAWEDDKPSMPGSALAFWHVTFLVLRVSDCCNGRPGVLPEPPGETELNCGGIEIIVLLNRKCLNRVVELPVFGEDGLYPARETLGEFPFHAQTDGKARIERSFVHRADFVNRSPSFNANDRRPCQSVNECAAVIPEDLSGSAHQVYGIHPLDFSGHPGSCEDRREISVLYARIPCAEFNAPEAPAALPTVTAEET